MPNALEVMSPLAAVLGHKGGKKAPSAKPEEEDGIKKANDAIASSKKVLEGANKAFPSAKKPMVDSAKAPAAKPAPKTGLGAEAESAAAGSASDDTGRAVTTRHESTRARAEAAEAKLTAIRELCDQYGWMSHASWKRSILAITGTGEEASGG